jgi:hypothetical protein
MGRGEVHTEFWWVSLKERDHLGDRRIWDDNIRKDLKEIDWPGSG